MPTSFRELDTEAYMRFSCLIYMYGIVAFISPPCCSSPHQLITVSSHIHILANEGFSAFSYGHCSQISGLPSSSPQTGTVLCMSRFSCIFLFSANYYVLQNPFTPPQLPVKASWKPESVPVNAETVSCILSLDVML